MSGIAELLCEYAELLNAQKKHTDAVRTFKQSLALKGDNARALFGLGTAYEECDNFTLAMKAYNEALCIDSNFPEALYNLGLLYKRQMGNAVAAEDHYRKALALKPDFLDALNNLGVLLNNRGAFEESIILFRKALARQPDLPSVLNNLGIVLYYQGDFDESISILNRASALQPRHPDMLNNLGSSLRAAGRVSEAISVFEQAIALKDNCADYHCNLACALLASGRFEEGWHEYEWRWRTTLFADKNQNVALPQWQGENAAGRILLIRAEQGLGDTIQFCRYASLAANRGCRVVLEVPPTLVKLMGSVAGVEQVISRDQPWPNPDLYCHMMSLPAIFDTRLETIPAAIPYLAADDKCIDTWRNRLPHNSGQKLKVGLTWSGSQRINSPACNATDHRRSIPPELFAPLTKIEGIQFYSLQKDGPRAPAELKLVDMMDGCNDFADTAALVANLDLIISVDTAVVHLAGALGKPVWMLNRFDSCWRWLQTREDSPWYPTLRLFNQPRPGDWKSIIACVANELRKALVNPGGKLQRRPE